MSASPAPQQFMPYENFALGIRMKYPGDWWKQEQFGVPVIGFFSPPEGPTDFFRENLTVALEVVPADVTLQEYIDRSLSQASMQLPSFTVIASQSGSLADFPAVETLF